MLAAMTAHWEEQLGDREHLHVEHGRETAEESKRECYPRVGGEHGVARGEDEAQEIIPDVVVQRRIDVHGSGFDPLLSVGIEYLMRAIEPRRAAQGIDGAVFRCRHEPRPGIVGNADFRPSLERGDEGILCQILGDPDVAHHSGKPGDESR